jgi:sulfatase modifying factor 1
MNSATFTARCMSCIAVAVALSSSALAQIQIDYVGVGDLGNPADLATGNGSVSSLFSIGRYEVTNSEYATFLNSVDPFGQNLQGLYNPAMTSSALGGISFDNVAADGARYSAKPGYQNQPVVYVSFFDAMRFVNWIGNGSTETGSYELSDGALAERNPGATVWIPSLDEWYKAAYYQPAAAGGDTDGYWNFPMRTNDFPSSQPPPGTAPAGNFVGQDGNYAVTGSAGFDPDQNYLTEIGAYAGSNSHYGTFDQGGNVREWTDTIGTSPERTVLGGSWNDFVSLMSATNSLSLATSTEDGLVGFRVATMVPEPSTMVFAGFGAALLVSSRRRIGAACRKSSPA